MTILQITKSGTDMLLRVLGALFWFIRTFGIILLVLEAVKWVADLEPVNPRQCAFYAIMVLLGWAAARLCALSRIRLKAGKADTATSSRSAG